MSSINLARKKEQIKKIWKDHFRRDLSEEEVERKFNLTVKSSITISSHLKDFSTALLENYINASDVVSFSPKALMKELFDSVELLKDKFIDDTKFAEAYTAVQFVLAIRKATGDKLLITISDRPDIILFKLPIKKLSVRDGDRAFFEVLKCAPEFEGFRKDQFDEDFLNYIRKHKFSMQYGKKVWLVVPFLSKIYHGDVLKNFQKVVSKATDNPFENIYLSELIDQDYRHFKLYRIYPDYFSIEVNLNLEQDKKLIF
jgi:hypothetical protein